MSFTMCPELQSSDQGVLENSRSHSSTHAVRSLESALRAIRWSSFWVFVLSLIFLMVLFCKSLACRLSESSSFFRAGPATVPSSFLREIPLTSLRRASTDDSVVSHPFSTTAASRFISAWKASRKGRTATSRLLAVHAPLCSVAALLIRISPESIRCWQSSISASSATDATEVTPALGECEEISIALFCAELTSIGLSSSGGRMYRTVL
mmetsp:Transcript_3699/g.9676  ORF Transcript_3699/g.9676 Transcript_3699/m.9676 type:complete len:209 (+) Transcript_3699:2305-2931(+)